MGRLFLFAFAALFLGPRLAAGCSCIEQTPAQIYERADAVFVGDVGDVSETARRKTVRMRVVRAYKGSIQAGDPVTVTLPGGSSASCSLDWTAGARVVIFARATGGRLSTNLCQGSYQLGAGKPLPTLPPPA